jgi:RND family efflux transporter MFP subunit
VEGQLLDLSVDVGDLVSQGQTVGQIDDQILQTAVGEAAAELEARQSEVEQARSQVVDAETKVSQAQVELQQAEADAKRLETLALQGAISVQEAELAQTALKTAEQVLRSAEEQVRTREGAVEAAEGRVRSQEAAVEQARERLSYTGLSSPISGVVLERLAEPGNFMQAGNEVLKLGDFSSVKVMVQVSELDRATIRQGQPVQVSLDAFPNQTFSGRISRISPVADSTARLIPVEVTIPNRASDIGSGLLARVNFSAASPQAITVPESALQVGEAASGDVVFVVMGEGENATVQPRSVQVGDRADGQVEIRSGLEAGESYIIRSNQPLQAGQPVRLSILSEGA